MVVVDTFWSIVMLFTKKPQNFRDRMGNELPLLINAGHLSPLYEWPPAGRPQSCPGWALQDSREAKTRLPSQELTSLCPEFYFFFQRDENVRKQKDHAGPRCRRDEEEKREMTLIYCCCSQNSSSRHLGDQEPQPEASLLPGVANCFQRSPGSQLQANQSPLSARAERATCQGSGETVSLRVPTSGLHQHARGGDTLFFSSM